jgi:hypothetical protein
MSIWSYLPGAQQVNDAVHGNWKGAINPLGWVDNIGTAAGAGARTAAAGAQAAADAQKQASDLAWQRAQAAIPQIKQQWDPYNALYNKIYGAGSAWGFGGPAAPAGSPPTQAPAPNVPAGGPQSGLFAPAQSFANRAVPAVLSAPGNVATAVGQAAGPVVSGYDALLSKLRGL